jgi:hypothetical protein
MGTVGCRVLHGSRVLLVPLVHGALDAVAFGQQGAVLRGQVVDEGRETLPKSISPNAGARQGFVFDELVQRGCNLESVSGDSI